MLYYPGAITQFLSTGIFYIVLAAFVFLIGKVYWQKLEISSLKNDLRESKIELVECEGKTAVEQQKADGCEANLELLNKYYRRKPPPSVIKNDELDITHLFMEPRK
jgi:hypothetical protein